MKFTPREVDSFSETCEWAEWLFSLTLDSPTAASLRHRNLKERGGRASLSLSLFFFISSLNSALVSISNSLYKKSHQQASDKYLWFQKCFHVLFSLLCPGCFVVRSAVVFTAFQRAHISNTSNTLHFIIFIAGPAMRYLNFSLEFQNGSRWMFVFILIIGCMAPLRVLHPLCTCSTFFTFGPLSSIYRQTSQLDVDVWWWWSLFRII